MAHKSNFTVVSSESVVANLGKRLDAIRLSQNISQADLSKESGVSRRTLTRLAAGEVVSLDSFVRVMLALKLGDQLEALLPDPGIRPVERIRFKGTERKRARNTKKSAPDWHWGDEEQGS